ncbi:MAG: hypothetical protein OM95_16800 [Bdellovibrio sp. ArHS]|nr:MAG: hypothetical protein OM95_16800 [Bdellovibrio sp. ArHS]
MNMDSLQRFSKGRNQGCIRHPVVFFIFLPLEKSLSYLGEHLGRFAARQKNLCQKLKQSPPLFRPGGWTHICYFHRDCDLVTKENT